MQITLPDGAIKEFEGPVTGAQIAESISSGLLRAAVAIEVDGQEQDLSVPITTDSAVNILTLRQDAGLDIMRHTIAAQVLARATRELFPGSKLAIGPTIENGFYYDVEFDSPLSEDDLPRIEERMKAIVKEKNTITMRLLPRAEAVRLFKDRDEPYKVEIIEGTEGQDDFQIYFQDGTDFVDLCRGPHLQNLGQIGAFKLTKVAGAYWRGNSDNKMLTRIYGTAWPDNKALKRHLRAIEEAEKRDHRKLGAQLDLFHFQEEAIGQVFWHYKGWTLYTKLQEYIRAKLRRSQYREVNTPQIVSKVLYEKSGHWDKFGTGNMFITDAYDQTHALKPMNCPCHVQIFRQGIKSYRDLPIRMSEFGTCMRHEQRGALHGIMRVTSMTQDDGHVFCTRAQIEEEVVALCELIKEIYAEFGFDPPYVKFSDRPEQRVGSDAVWDAAEEALKNACDAGGLEWTLNPGEGAFYGPKLEFVLRDCLGRHWQCGTVQLDFNLSERLDAHYIDENGDKQAPILIHRALLGSLERFVGILIEHFAGHFPMWLAPTQVVLTGISSAQDDAVKKVESLLFERGFRVQSDLRNEKVNFKVREHSLQKVPFIGVIGAREAENGTVTIRRFGSKQQQTLSLDEWIDGMEAEIASRALPPGFGLDDV
ncbi:MAG: threonine--tRNA ligase [Myxococcota bacterium]|nr:threonine--tRNA ligase [Myxococcota bacterium]